MKKCSFCGHEMPDEAVFCGACGNRYEEAQIQDYGAEYEGAGGEEPAGKICPRCGCHNLPDAVFCQECRWDMSKPYSENQATKTVNKDKRKGKKSVLPMAVGGIFLLIILAAGVLFGIRYLKNNSKETWSLAKAELAENYLQPENRGTVDLSARNHQPAGRDLSAVWDQTLFYWLEDVGGEDDNHIAACAMTRIELKRNDNGNTIEYEVYRDSETDEIYKIVSIEHMEDGSLELSDYYYRDGKPNFVFRRSDTVYTPTYASIDKVGERYYFTNDQMVKWRWIYEPSVVNQWILTPEDTWYTQWGYQAISDGERASTMKRKRRY
ncbi:zinc ribbon domain-containing protein [Clostridium sp. AM58-1XD]|uniref:zinc ribbon domain-containing protein n=1 Tax=Clostridium sp. AM58-1XD TaxID=2292307 RepID=UPI000E46A702|nr:zinc ribbon domain-containing protein [Clostridium sp. AM58-1XD]RGY99442.1 hypothetical protein DXA13_07995 [Clostridium sp. AM58-1XD]